MIYFDCGESAIIGVVNAMSTDPTELIEGSNGGDQVSSGGSDADESSEVEPTEVFDPTTEGDGTSSDDGGE